MLKVAEPGATFLLNSPYGPDEIWDQLPREVQQQIIDKGLKFYVVDALKVARETEMGVRINTIMQTCFFALADVLPRDQAIEQIKQAIRKTYGKRGESILRRNFAAVDAALATCTKFPYRPRSPASRNACRLSRRTVPISCSASLRCCWMAVATCCRSAPCRWMVPFPPTRPRSRNGVSPRDSDLGSGHLHRVRIVRLGLPARGDSLEGLSARVVKRRARRLPFQALEGQGAADHLMTIQVAPDDCTGCGVCVDVCPAKSKEVVKHKAINMEPKLEHLDRERANFDYFLELPELDRTQAKIETVKGSQLLEPLFEFSGRLCGLR